MYELHDTFILRLADGAYIPKDDGNRDYREYLDWCAAGNAPSTPAPLPVFVPGAVSRLQARVALKNAGKLDAVQALMNDPATPFLYVEAWNNALSFERDSATVAAMSAALGWTSADVDQLFIDASKVTA